MQQLSSRVLAPAELRGGGRASVRAVARAPVTIKAFVSEPKNGLEYVKTLPGITPPTGFFDPWDFTKSPTFTVAEAKRFRESEITHGRVAMLAAVGWVVQEQWHPLFGGNVGGPATRHFQQIQAQWPQFWAILLLFIGAHEAWRIRTGWTTEGGSVLKADREPGDLGFDPLKLFPRDNPEAAYDLQSKELNNGRLAMIAVAGFAAQEFVDPTPIWTRLMNHGLAGPNVSGYWAFDGSLNGSAAAGGGSFNTGMSGVGPGIESGIDLGGIAEKAGDAFSKAKLPGLPSGGDILNSAPSFGSGPTMPNASEAIPKSGGNW